jgi:hypothetical protein
LCKNIKNNFENIKNNLFVVKMGNKNSICNRIEKEREYFRKQFQPIDNSTFSKSFKYFINGEEVDIKTLIERDDEKNSITVYYDERILIQSEGIKNIVWKKDNYYQFNNQFVFHENKLHKFVHSENQTEKYETILYKNFLLEYIEKFNTYILIFSNDECCGIFVELGGNFYISFGNKIYVFRRNILIIIVEDEQKIKNYFIGFEDICRIVKIKVPKFWYENYVITYKKLRETNKNIFEKNLFKMILDFI